MHTPLNSCEFEVRRGCTVQEVNLQMEVKCNKLSFFFKFKDAFAAYEDAVKPIGYLEALRLFRGEHSGVLLLPMQDVV